jgi:hypothetical protein
MLTLAGEQRRGRVHNFTGVGSYVVPEDGPLTPAVQFGREFLHRAPGYAVLFLTSMAGAAGISFVLWLGKVVVL